MIFEKIEFNSSYKPGISTHGISEVPLYLDIIIKQICNNIITSKKMSLKFLPKNV